jgi:UDP-sulfoquinovose synthase
VKFLNNNIAIFGADGYIGWPLAIHLARRYPDKKIILVDNLVTRKLVRSVGSRSLVPIRSMEERIASYERVAGRSNLEFVFADLRDSDIVDRIFRKYLPESIVHLAQQRSAPFSMIDQEHAMYTQQNNIATNLNILFSMLRHTPSSHLLKMGSMGEYGTPGIEIAEGEVELNRKGDTAKVPFPYSGLSWYHLSKIFDTYNVKLANKLFELTATDVMQGVVYGVRVDEMIVDDLATRFDFDSNWGTLINKYVVQSVALNKLLIYGKGKQKRGFLSLYDSINCLTLLIENPPTRGDYRIVNQLDEIYDTLQLAKKVQSIGRKFGIETDFEWVKNPRVEKEEHYYQVEHKILPSLGFKREKELDDVLNEIFEAVLRNKDRINGSKELIYPTVDWKSAKTSRCSNFRLPKEVLAIQGSDIADHPPNEEIPIEVFENAARE